VHVLQGGDKIMIHDTALLLPLHRDWHSGLCFQFKNMAVARLSLCSGTETSCSLNNLRRWVLGRAAGGTRITVGAAVLLQVFLVIIGLQAGPAEAQSRNRCQVEAPRCPQSAQCQCSHGVPSCSLCFHRISE
jgi:hypothetical protein